MGRHPSSSLPSGLPVLILESFVEDFFNNSRKLSLAESSNPHKELAVPPRAKKE